MGALGSTKLVLLIMLPRLTRKGEVAPDFSVRRRDTSGGTRVAVGIWRRSGRSRRDIRARVAKLARTIANAGRGNRKIFACAACKPVLFPFAAAKNRKIFFAAAKYRKSFACGAVLGAFGAESIANVC